jgi:hypothetical protein
MRSVFMLAGLLLLGLAAGATADDKDKKKGTKVELDGLTSTTPATWEKIKPKGTMRHAQFSLPKDKDDDENAELVIFKGFGGSVKENADRWKKQFTPPKDKKAEDVTKESKVKVGDAEGAMLDVSGTYNAPPFDPTFKGKKEGFRLLGIQVKLGENNYHILLKGPAKTVEKHKKDFEAWLKAFKK